MMNLIELEPGLPMRSVFTSTQVYSGSKVRHFGAIRKDTGIPYEDMIFFDDWDQNCIDVGSLGVTCIECPRVRETPTWNSRAFMVDNEDCWSRFMFFWPCFGGFLVHISNCIDIKMIACRVPSPKIDQPWLDRPMDEYIYMLYV